MVRFLLKKSYTTEELANSSALGKKNTHKPLDTVKWEAIKVKLIAAKKYDIAHLNFVDIANQVCHEARKKLKS